MKKVQKLQIAFIALLLPYTMNAQTSWNISGNSGTVKGTHYIGTNDAVGFIIKTNNSSRLTVESGGKVGIGTTTPSVKLHVTGGSDVSLSGGGYFLAGSPTSSNIVIDDNEIMARLNGTAATLFFNYDGGNVTVSANSNSGKLGIGTSAPKERLDVNGNVNADGDYKIDGETVISGDNGKVTLGTQNCDCVIVVVGGKETLVLNPNCSTGVPDVRVAGALRVGSGTIKGDTTNADIDMEGAPTAGRAAFNVSSLASGNITTYGIKTKNAQTNGYGYGMYSEGGRYGLYSLASGSTYTSSCYGLYGSSTGSGGLRFGIYGRAVNSSANIVNYGVYGTASGGSTNYAGYFSGDLVYTGSLINASDAKLKENIKPLDGALDKINKLHVKTYNFKPEYAFMNTSKNAQIGLIAQEVEKVFPTLVSDILHPADYNPETNEKISDEVHFKGVNYIGLVPVLVAAVKEQQAELESFKTIREENREMKEQLSTLRRELDELKNYLKQSKVENSRNNELQKSSLEQNNPNPFSKETVINYSISENSESASINVYSTDNKLLKSYSLNSPDRQLTISGKSFPAGTYIFELTVDGKTIDSKKMILTK